MTDKPVAKVATEKPQRLPDNATIDYAIQLNDKTLELRNVPIKDNNTYLQSQIISLYSVMEPGEYRLENSDITVTVKEN